MNKKKRIMTIVITVIAVCVVGLCAYKAYPSVAIKPALADKYGWNKSDIKILKHKNAHYEHDFGFFGLDAMDPPIWRINEKWVCEYKGREFNVEYTDRQFADDYQLEDIFKWCTEWLQENVDPEIVGVEVCSDIIYHSSENSFDYDLPWNTKNVFSKDDAQALILEQSKRENKDGICIFYQTDDLFLFFKETIKKRRIIYGNAKYDAYCERKQKTLSSFSYMQGAVIALVDEHTFSRNSNPIGICSQTPFSLDLNVEHYVKGFTNNK